MLRGYTLFIRSNLCVLKKIYIYNYILYIKIISVFSPARPSYKREHHGEPQQIKTAFPIEPMPINALGDHPDGLRRVRGMSLANGTPIQFLRVCSWRDKKKTQLFKVGCHWTQDSGHS